MSADFDFDDMDTVRDARWAQECLGFAIDKLLRARGWRTTSDVPGCFVLWTKDIRGRAVLAVRDTALALEERSDEEAAAQDAEERRSTKTAEQSRAECADPESCPAHRGEGS